MKKNYETEIYFMCKQVESTDLLQLIKNLADQVCWQIDQKEETTLDDICYLLYESYVIMEAINPRYTPEVNFVSALILILEEWEENQEFVNKALGLPPES